MKFIYSLMLVTFLMTTFASATGWGGVTEEASAQCVKEIGPNKGNDKNWAASYEACLKRKGVRQTSDGKYVQSYHYDNDQYKTCTTGINKNNTPDQVDKCMRSATSAPAKTPVADNTKGDPCQGKVGQAWGASGKCECQTGYVSTGAATLTCVKAEVKNNSNEICNGVTTKKGCTCNQPQVPYVSGNISEVVNAQAGVEYTSDDGVLVDIYDCKNPTVTQAAQPTSEDLSDCFAVYQKLVVTCKQDAQSAVNKCDASSEENKSNSNFANLGDLLKGASAAAVQGKSGSGAYEACLNTALTTQAGFFATEELNSSTCTPAIEQCKSSCENIKNGIESNREAIINQCVNLARDNYIKEFKSFDDENPESKFINNTRASSEQALDQVIAQLEEGQSDCDVDAVSNQEKLKKASNDFNNAAKQAQVCRCQTGSTGEDCSAIKGPAQCVLNPSAAGCALSTLNCNNSNSIQCRCLKNPNLAECKSGGGGPSGFVGKPFTNPGVSPESNIAPKITGDFDVSFDDEPIAGVSGTEGVATSPFGTSQAAGAGGGAPSGAPGAGGEEPAAAEEKTGLNALLDKPKGFIGGLLNKLGFGGGNATDKKYKTDANGRKIDPSKWKPGMLRGVAGDGSEIGPKHRDIWKQMNSQYFLQEKTFISGK